MVRAVIIRTLTGIYSCITNTGICIGKNTGFPGSSDSKESTCNAGDPGSIPGLGRSPGDGNGNPLQYSCLENPVDGGILYAIVHWVAKSWTRLRDLNFLIQSEILYN